MTSINLKIHHLKLDKTIFETLNLKPKLRTMNWLDPRQGYVGNLKKLLGATTNK